jgi:hypothetical protein
VYNDAPPLGAVAAHVLALFVVFAQPVASLAWLGGAHATLEQAAVHQAAVEHGHNHHHGALGQHEYQPAERNEPNVHFLRSTHGPEYASAAPYAGLFQDLLQTLLQAMLAMVLDTPSPGDPSGGASLTEGLPSQHSPPVPHRPPILFLPTLAFVQE